MRCKLQTDGILLFHTKLNQTFILYTQPLFIVHTFVFVRWHAKPGHFIRFAIIVSVGYTTRARICVFVYTYKIIYFNIYKRCSRQIYIYCCCRHRCEMKEVETASPIVAADATRTGCLRKYVFFSISGFGSFPFPKTSVLRKQKTKIFIYFNLCNIDMIYTLIRTYRDIILKRKYISIVLVVILFQIKIYFLK